MKYQGWMLLFAGLSVVPQLACSAGSWGAPAPDLGRHTLPSAQASERYRYRPNSPRVNTAYVPRYAGGQYPMPGYRFRPWERSSSTPPAANRFSARTVPSYWGVMPSREWRNAPYPATNQFRRTAEMAWPHRGAVPLAGRANYGAQSTAAASYPQYRFRPLPANRQARVERSVRYLPLQIQVPNRYVFRPLNPVARPAPQARPMPPIRYASMPYPNSMVGGAAMPLSSPQQRPWLNPQYRYRPYYPAPAMAALPYGASALRPAYYRYLPSMAGNGNPAVWSHPLPQQGLVGQSRQHSQNQWRPSLGRRYAQRHFYRRQSAPPPAPRFLHERMPAWGGVDYRVSRSVSPRPPVPVARLNPYGTDWYDGRGDGEGAWYSLVIESAPAVSQAWEPVSATGQ
jgi:hypothetical protein